MSADWCVVRLADIASKITKGTTPSKKDGGFSEAGINYIKAESVGYDGRIDSSKFSFITEDVHNKLKRSQLEVNDILFSMAGVHLGKVGVVEQKHVPANTNQALALIRLKGDLVKPLYVLYFLQQREVVHFVNNATSQSAQPNINLQDIGNLEIRLPSFEVQKNIVNILSSLDNKIELNNQTNQTLEQMAQAIFKSWFVDFEPVKAKIAALEAGGSEDDALLAAMQAIAGSALFATDAADADAQTQLARLQAEHPEQYATLRATAELFPSAMQDSELGEIPDGWEIQSIGEAVTAVGGGTPSTKNPEYWDDGVINWTTPKDLSSLQDKILTDTSRKITEQGLAKISSRLLSVDTVLMSSRAPVGYLALAKIPVAINQGYIAMKCDKVLTPEYVLQWCSASMEEIKGRAGGTTFAEISRTSFREIPVIVPSQGIITNYSDTVKIIYELITKNILQTKTLAEIRDTLLPRLLSGEIDVSAITD